MTETIGVAELKRRFSEVLNRVELRGDRVAVRRRGKVVALIGPLGRAEADAAPSRPRRGLAAAAGAWEEYEDLAVFLDLIRRARDEAAGRTVEPLG